MPAYLGTLGDDLYDASQLRLDTLAQPVEDTYGLGDTSPSPLNLTTNEVAGTTPSVNVAPGTGGTGPRAQGPADNYGVGTRALGAGVPRWATWAPAAPAQSVAEAIKARMGGRGLSKDPQLPAAPGGSYTDSQYQAENASLEQQVNAAYADILQQTGFDVGGVHTPGSVEMGAARKERDYLTEMVNAANDVTSQMQQAGTIFSGYHAGERARREQPMITGLGDLNVDTPNTLARLTEQAGDLMRQFIAQRNALLSQAAWRQEQRLLASRDQGASVPDEGTTTTPKTGYPISGGTGFQEDATYPETYPTGPGAQPEPWEPSGDMYYYNGAWYRVGTGPRPNAPGTA